MDLQTSPRGEKCKLILTVNSLYDLSMLVDLFRATGFYLFCIMIYFGWKMIYIVQTSLNQNTWHNSVVISALNMKILVVWWLYCYQYLIKTILGKKIKVYVLLIRANSVIICNYLFIDKFNEYSGTHWSPTGQ